MKTQSSGMLDYKQQLKKEAAASREELINQLLADRRVIDEEGAEEREMLRVSLGSEKKALERRLEKVLIEEQSKFDNMVLDLQNKSKSDQKSRATLMLDRALHRHASTKALSIVATLKQHMLEDKTLQLRIVAEEAAAEHADETEAVEANFHAKLKEKDDSYMALQEKMIKEAEEAEQKISEMEKAAEQANLDRAKQVQDVKDQNKQRICDLQSEIETMAQENEQAQAELGEQKQSQIAAEEEVAQLRATKEIVDLLKTAESDASQDVVGQMSQKIGQLTLERDRLDRLSTFKEQEIETLQVEVEKFADEADMLQDESERMSAQIRTLERTVDDLKEDKFNLMKQMDNLNRSLNETAKESESGKTCMQPYLEAEGILEQFLNPDQEEPVAGKESEASKSGITIHIRRLISMHDALAQSSITLQQSNKDFKAENEKLSAELSTVTTQVQTLTQQLSAAKQQTESWLAAKEEPAPAPAPIIDVSGRPEPELYTKDTTTGLVAQAIDQTLAPAAYLSTDSAEGLQDDAFLNMLPLARLHAFQAISNQLQQYGSNTNELRRSLAELKIEVDGLEARLLEDKVDPELAALLTTIESETDAFEYNAGIPQAVFAVASHENITSDFEEKLKQADAKAAKARKDERKQKQMNLQLLEQIQRLQSSNKQLRQVNSELQAEIDLIPGEKGSLLKEHAALQSERQKEERQLQDMLKEKQAVEKDLEEEKDKNLMLSRWAEKNEKTLKTNCLIDSKRYKSQYLPDIT